MKKYKTCLANMSGRKQRQTVTTSFLDQSLTRPLSTYSSLSVNVSCEKGKSKMLHGPVFPLSILRLIISLDRSKIYKQTGWELITKIQEKTII